MANPFTKIAADRVDRLGEIALIENIRRWLGDTSPAAPFGIGDDCAVVRTSGRLALVTTDPVIFGHHFDASVGARQAGAKLLKRNLSDIAAMGGKPRVAVLSLALAPSTSRRWLRDFYLGLASCARAHRVRIVGGDITQAPERFFGAFLTLHGESGPRGRLVTRQGARPGDLIAVTGRLGGSRLGHHLTFNPRLQEGGWLARRPEVRAMMDISDGVAKDVICLTPRGSLPSLDEAAMPCSSAARNMAVRSGRPALFHALCDGEDFELLVAIDHRCSWPRLRQAWARRFPGLPLTLIGRFTQGGESPTGKINLGDYHGYEHLSALPARAPRRKS